MSTARTSRRTVLTGLATVSAAAGLGVVTSPAPAQAASGAAAQPARGTGPTVVLVHGAFAPDEGEPAFALSAGGTLQDVVAGVPVPGGGTDVELSIRQEEFRKAFISEVGPAAALVMAATQRPIMPAALGSPSGPPAYFVTHPNVVVDLVRAASRATAG